MFMVLQKLLLSIGVLAGIYGANDLLPPSRMTPVDRELARSVAILVPKAHLSTNADGTINLETYPMSESIGLCSSEPWAETQAFYTGCSGFLVAPDLMLTAGHCMVNEGRAVNTMTPFCETFTWLWDFQEGPDGQPQIRHIPAERFVGCEQVIEAVHDSVFNETTRLFDFRSDYAITRLQKKVSGRTPLKISPRRIQAGEAISMIGYPLGGPQKYSRGHVISNEATYERAAIDSFPGNSGSPVFNADREVIGIMVRGYPESAYMRPGEMCRRLSHCDENALHCQAPQEVLTPPGEHIFPAFLLGPTPASR